jgi:YceI-like domain
MMPDFYKGQKVNYGWYGALFPSSGGFVKKLLAQLRIAVMEDSASGPPARPSSATERSRRYRQRRRLGTPCITVNVNDSAGVSASGTLKRSDFGMKTYLGAIGDDVDLIIEIEAKKKS